MWRISDGRIDRMAVFKWVEDGYRPVGELLFEGGRRVRQGSFVYARSWLAREQAVPIDPVGLPLRRGRVAGAPHELPLAFYDVGPDGWGKQVLIAAFPRLHLGMAEFLAMGSTQRTGDLAFGPGPEAPGTWVPGDAPLLALPRDDDDLDDLLVAAAAVESGQPADHHLRLLFRKSADVGGARPKARLHHDGMEWIAKFPAEGDSFDDPRMEAVCLDLAETAGVATPRRQVLTVRGKTVLLVQRFDRSPAGGRYGYVSAATLLKQPATTYFTDRTYVDVAVAARAIGVAEPEREMYRRLLVNAFLHNTDDHLRNMAVLWCDGRWRFSPVFDLVPHRMARHVLAPAPGFSPAHHVGTAAASHAAFGIAPADARMIFDAVVDGMRSLPAILDRREVTAKDQATVAELMTACLAPPAWPPPQ